MTISISDQTHAYLHILICACSDLVMYQPVKHFLIYDQSDSCRFTSNGLPWVPMLGNYWVLLTATYIHYTDEWLATYCTKKKKWKSMKKYLCLEDIYTDHTKDKSNDIHMYKGTIAVYAN